MRLSYWNLVGDEQTVKACNDLSAELELVKLS